MEMPGLFSMLCPSEAIVKFAFTDNDHARRLTEGLNNAYEHGYLTDTIITISEYELLKVHRTVVEIFKDVLRDLISQAEQVIEHGTQNTEYCMKAQHGKIIRDVMVWIYTGKMKESIEVIIPCRYKKGKECHYKLLQDGILGVWLWNDTNHCDVTLKIQGHDISAHKVILSIFSSYFHSMFSHNMKESRLNHITLHEPSLETSVVYSLVYYMYSGEITITGDNVQNLLVGANFLGVSIIQEACINFIISNMDASNCASISNFANLYGNTNLSQTAKAFLLRHFLLVSKDNNYLELPLNVFVELLSSDKLCCECNGILLSPTKCEAVVYKVAMQYIQHNPLVTDAEAIRQILGCVRGYVMDKKLLHQVVKDMHRHGFPSDCFHVPNFGASLPTLPDNWKYRRAVSCIYFIFLCVQVFIKVNYIGSLRNHIKSYNNSRQLT